MRSYKKKIKDADSDGASATMEKEDHCAHRRMKSGSCEMPNPVKNINVHGRHHSDQKKKKSKNKKGGKSGPYIELLCP
jgi:hypothetical protein